MEPRPAPPLQTAPAGTIGQEEREIRETLGRAARDLNLIDANTLSVDARAQYETARRFLRQTEDALRDRNFVFARSLVDKAAALATSLARR